MALENKLGITNSAELAREEERISKRKAVELFESGALDKLAPGRFASLQAIHKALFEEMSSSAGYLLAFLEKAKRFRSIDELTPELLRLFIQRIEIGERAKKDSHSAAQDIRIVYRDIGVVDSNMEKGEQPVHMVTLPQSIDEIVKMLA